MEVKVNRRWLKSSKVVKTAADSKQLKQNGKSSGTNRSSCVGVVGGVVGGVVSGVVGGVVGGTCRLRRGGYIVRLYFE